MWHSAMVSSNANSLFADENTRESLATSEVTDENMQPLHCLSQREMNACIDQTLNELVHAAIATAERKQERSLIIEEARSTGNEHVVLFLEQYFANSDGSHPDAIFSEFINAIPFPSPAYFVFGSEKLFDGVTFKQVLEDRKSNVVERLPIALMQMFQTDVPADCQGLWEGLDTLDGSLLMDTILGPRFHQEVKSLGLLDPPKPPPRAVSRASVSDRESDYADRSSSPLLPESVKPPERVQIPRSPTLQESDTDLPELTSSGHEQPEEVSQLEDHVTEPAIDVDTMVTEEISQSSPDVSRVTNPPLQDEGARTSESPRGTRISEGSRGRQRPSRIPIRLQRIKSVPASKLEKPFTSLSSQSASPHGLKEPFNFSMKLQSKRTATRTHTATTQAAFNTREEKHQGLSAHAKQPNTGASRTPKTVQCQECGIRFPATAIRNPRKVFRDFAERISQWKVLAQFLKVSDIENIDRMYEFQYEKCFQMLCSWQKQSGNAATYLKLAEGFKHVKQEYLIKELHDRIQPSVAEAISDSYEAEIDLAI